MKNSHFTRRDFLKTAGAIGLVAATGGSIPLTMFASGCPSGGAPAGDQILRVNLASEPAQIDPNRASWAQELTVIRQSSRVTLTVVPAASPAPDR